jgi:hypothetical protein
MRPGWRSRDKQLLSFISEKECTSKFSAMGFRKRREAPLVVASKFVLDNPTPL